MTKGREEEDCSRIRSHEETKKKKRTWKHKKENCVQSVSRRNVQQRLRLEEENCKEEN
jgi:hypothetical protein